MPLINSLMLPFLSFIRPLLSIFCILFLSHITNYDCSVLYRKSSDYRDRRMKSALRNERSE